MRREAKTKKSINAKATKDALIKRRLAQAKQFEGYSGACSQEEHPYGDLSADRGVHAQQDKEYPFQRNNGKASHDMLPASRSAVPNKDRTKESQKRKIPGKPVFIQVRLSNITNKADCTCFSSSVIGNTFSMVRVHVYISGSTKSRRS